MIEKGKVIDIGENLGWKENGYQTPTNSDTMAVPQFSDQFYYLPSPRDFCATLDDYIKGKVYHYSSS